MRRGLAALAVAVSAVLAGSAPAGTGVEAVFRDAARAYHVPFRLLLTVGKVNTGLRMPGHPAMNGGYGVMDLTPAQLRRAARLVRIDPVRARHDLRQNVVAGAALLASLRRRGTWYDALTRLGGRPFADQVFLEHGRPTPKRALAAAGPRAEYPNAHWLPASPSNYNRANRPLSDPITSVVIHTTEGSYGGTLSWFRNPASHATTHYVIRSSDGDVTQMVREKDEAWHSGNGEVNDTSIGIEHEAWIAQCKWYTDAMYRSSAQLSAYLALKYMLPIDRTHFIGHNEVPDPNHPGQFGGYSHHTDPGRCWNWPKYMALIRDYAAASVGTTVQRLADDASRSFAAPGSWKRTVSAAAHGRSFWSTAPSSTGYAARFSVKVPVTGRYALYSWWPTSAARNSSVPVGIETARGLQWVRVDQRAGTGWRYLGSFSLAGGKKTTIRFSPRTSMPGSIAADAVKLELLTARPTGSVEPDAGGWAATSRGLSATRDGGRSWRSVSPPGVGAEQIRGVRLSGTNGWLVAATSGAKRPLVLYRTADRGATWTSTPLPVPSDVDVAGPVDVSAPDATRLFVGLRLEPSRWSLSRGLLLRSADGGATWLKKTLPAGGEVSFPTPLDGWLVAGLTKERLYVTHDGGKTWKPMKPAAPISGATSTTYALPTFTSELDGVLPVTFGAGTRSTLAFYVSYDGGRAWTLATQVRIGKAVPFAAAMPTSIVDENVWFAAIGTRLVATPDGGLTKKTVGTLPGTARAIHFASATTGWAWVGTKLYSTADGGATWTRLKPP